MGDFNEILNGNEKIDGPLRNESQMRGFRDAVRDLMVMGYQGPMVTWWNSFTQLRLDRAMCTLSWWDMFGHSKVRHLPPSDSDHVPFLLQASNALLTIHRSYYGFKFESFWLLHENCHEVIESAWHTDVYGTSMFQVVNKIKYVRLQLDAWQRTKFKNRQIDMLTVRGRMEELLDIPLTTEICEEKKQLQAKVQRLLIKEDRFLQQRAKVTWLQSGDRNTSYFHWKTSNHKRKNVLTGLYDVNGTWHNEDEGMENVVTSYFRDIFQSQPIDMEANESVLAAILPSVIEEMNSGLLAPYTKHEIRQALFQMYSSKSSGPDGVPSLFFSKLLGINW